MQDCCSFVYFITFAQNTRCVMKERFHITRKVLIGYGLLIAAAILSVIYIFNIVEEFATDILYFEQK
jgi:uncharacterized membrane protein (DUF485 family)